MQSAPILAFNSYSKTDTFYPPEIALSALHNMGIQAIPLLLSHYLSTQSPLHSTIAPDLAMVFEGKSCKFYYRSNYYFSRRIGEIKI